MFFWELARSPNKRNSITFIVLLIAEQGEYPGGIRVLLEIVYPRNKQNCILLVIKVSEFTRKMTNRIILVKFLVNCKMEGLCSFLGKFLVYSE